MIKYLLQCENYEGVGENMCPLAKRVFDGTKAIPP